MPRQRLPVKVGDRYGRLTVIAENGRYLKHVQWQCRCDCSREKLATSTHLRRGLIVSCGCKQRENAYKAHAASVKHGRSTTSEYHSWSSMLGRCFNPNNDDYDHYGGRGIKVCDRWKNSFENFYEDMGDKPSSKHSIDRVNVNGNYEPNNCRWATAKQQLRNKRTNNYVTINGETRTVPEWAEISGLSYDLCNGRYDKFIRRGLWPPERLISPVRSQRIETVHKNHVLITFEGLTMNMSKWAKKFGLHPLRIQARYRKGWRPPELFRPVRSKVLK